MVPVQAPESDSPASERDSQEAMESVPGSGLALESGPDNR